jgi:Rad3-related DNA helicase
MALYQGLGRLLRRVEDRGVIVILDRRRLTRSYGGFLLKNLPPAPISSYFSAVKRFFFAGYLP